MKKPNSRDYTPQTAARLYAACEKSDPHAHKRALSNILFLKGQHRADAIRDMIEVCADRMHMDVVAAIQMVRL